MLLGNAIPQPMSLIRSDFQPVGSDLPFAGYHQSRITNRWDVMEKALRQKVFAKLFFLFALAASLPAQILLAEDSVSNRKADKNTTEKKLTYEMEYPPTKKESIQDNYHGTMVEDPYRWLEDTESKETAAWVKAQNGVTFCYLESIAQRKKIHDRLTKLWNYERYAQPVKYGDRYFYSHNNGLQNQSVLYTSESLNAQREVLLDPNNLREDGTVSLAGWVPSDDGKYLAYSLASPEAIGIHG